MSTRPLPQSDPATQAYWQAAHEHRLDIPQCLACMNVHFYPRARCPYCGSGDLTWISCSGKGHVYSYTIVKRAPSDAFEPLVPYVVAIVALDEGPHLMTNIVDCDPNNLKIDNRVQVRFFDINDKTTLPVFAPEKNAVESSA